MYEMEGPRTIPLHHLPISQLACVARPVTTPAALPHESGFPAPAASEVSPGLASICK